MVIRSVVLLRIFNWLFAVERVRVILFEFKNKCVLSCELLCWRLAFVLQHTPPGAGWKWEASGWMDTTVNIEHSLVVSLLQGSSPRSRHTTTSSFDVYLRTPNGWTLARMVMLVALCLCLGSFLSLVRTASIPSSARRQCFGLSVVPECSVWLAASHSIVSLAIGGRDV